jgi:hypothetical protein
MTQMDLREDIRKGLKWYERFSNKRIYPEVSQLFVP